MHLAKRIILALSITLCVADLGVGQTSSSANTDSSASEWRRHLQVLDEASKLRNRIFTLLNNNDLPQAYELAKEFLQKYGNLKVRERNGEYLNDKLSAFIRNYEPKKLYNRISALSQNEDDKPQAYELANEYLAKYGNLNLMADDGKSLNNKLSAWMKNYEPHLLRKTLDWLNEKFGSYASWSVKDEKMYFLQTVNWSFFTRCDKIHFSITHEGQAVTQPVVPAISTSHDVTFALTDVDASNIRAYEGKNNASDPAPWKLELNSLEGKKAFKVRRQGIYSEQETYIIEFVDKDIAPRMAKAFSQAVRLCVKEKESEKDPF